MGVIAGDPRADRASWCRWRARRMTDMDSGGSSGGGGGAVSSDDGGGSVAQRPPRGAVRRRPRRHDRPRAASGASPPARATARSSARSASSSRRRWTSSTRVADQITSVTNRHGGFVLSSSLSTGDEGAGGDFELRIPSNRLRPALRDLSALATVRSQSQSGRDVTREHVTARDRLAGRPRRAPQPAAPARGRGHRRGGRGDPHAARHGLGRDQRPARPAARPAPADRLRSRDGHAPGRRGRRRAKEPAARGSFDDALGDAGDLLAATARASSSGCSRWRCRSA